MPTGTSLTQDGITINFSSSVTYGAYAGGNDSGRFYVVGDFTVDNVTVNSGSRVAGSVTGRDGIQKNPATESQGFDSRDPYYYNSGANLGNSSIPTVVGDRLIFTESHYPDPLTSAGDPYYVKKNLQITCVSTTPAATELSPAPYGPLRVWDMANISGGWASKLLNLVAPVGFPTMSTIADTILKCDLDPISQWNGKNTIPTDNRAGYGRDYCKQIIKAILFLMCRDADVGDRTQIVKNIIQRGIDTFGLAEAGRNWRPNGGHMQGRMFLLPILYKFFELEDIRTAFTSAQFQEIGQTWRVTSADIGRAINVALTATASAGSANSFTLPATVGGVNIRSNVYALKGNTFHVTSGTGAGQDRIVAEYNYSTGVGSPTVNFSPAIDNTSVLSFDGYTTADFDEWGITHDFITNGNKKDNPSEHSSYRIQTGPYWVAGAMVLSALGLRDFVAHPAFFGYCYRMLHDGLNSVATMPPEAWDKLMTDLYGETYLAPPPASSLLQCYTTPGVELAA